jgi:hypothetical protein
MSWAGPYLKRGDSLALPWLIQSETLHYGYAIVMLAGLWLLRTGFTGVSDRRWWTIALGIQFFHHIEHALLLGQVIVGRNLAGRPCRQASCSSGCRGLSSTFSTTRWYSFR